MSAAMVLCGPCGQQVHKSARACPGCGAVQSRSGRHKSKVVAALLALLIGGFGVHRFYLGQWRGLVYLLFFWTLIPGLVALVEAIVFLCSNDQKWDARYNDGIASDSGGASVVVVAVVAVFAVIFLVGILAAIALPAYQDYTLRAKVAGAAQVGRAAAAAVADHVRAHRELPLSLADAGYTAALPIGVRSIQIDRKSGVLTVTMATEPLDGQSFHLVPAVDEQKNVVWRCVAGSLAPKHLPLECRATGAPA